MPTWINDLNLTAARKKQMFHYLDYLRDEGYLKDERLRNHTILTAGYHIKISTAKDVFAEWEDKHGNRHN